MMDFASRLRELRNMKGLSQAELAKKLGVSKSRISMYELGERQPDFETLELISDYFNVNLDYLLGKEDVSTYIITPEQKEIVDAVFADDDLMFLLRKAMNNNYKKRLRKMMELMDAMDEEEPK